MSYPFVPARWFTSTNGRVVDLVVIHSMEAPEKGDTAESVAKFFKGLPSPPPDRRASAHYCVDNNSIVQCVAEKDVAFAAPGANHNGVHIELAGYARQSETEWSDEFSDAMLRRAAALTADLCSRHGIQIRFRDASDLQVGGERLRGITTHAEVSRAWRKTDHTDPGAGFPMRKFIEYVNAAGGSPERKAMAKVPNAVDACLIPGFRSTKGPGVWVLASDGGVFTFPENCSAPFHGSMGGKALNGPMCKIVTTGTATGYYLVAEDGGIFAFGLAKPIKPYAKFGDEFRAGVHKIIGAEWIGTALVLVADDGATYTFET